MTSTKERPLNHKRNHQTILNKIVANAIQCTSIEK